MEKYWTELIQFLVKFMLTNSQLAVIAAYSKRTWEIWPFLVTIKISLVVFKGDKRTFE